MPDTKPSVPRPNLPSDQVPTQPVVTAVTGDRVVEEFLRKLDAKFDRLDDKVETGFSESANRDLQLVQRVSRLETRVDDVEAQGKSRSLRVRSTSENDLRQDSAIGLVYTRLDKVEANQKDAAVERANTSGVMNEIRVDVKEALTKNPKLANAVLGVAFAILGLLLAAIAYATAYLNTHGAHQ